jgi:drug/metabolite transporter (DMT)-like permease
MVYELSDSVRARLPLFYVFLSGIGFSLQTLIIKLISEQGFRGSFQCVFLRGTVQLILSGIFIYYDKDRLEGKGPMLFGDTNWVRFILFMRALAGFGSIAFAFLAVELIPIGDSTVLIMLSPLMASILSYIFLGESWRWPELCGTLLSLIGAVMVAQPPLLFGGNPTHDGSFYKGVGYALTAACSAACAFIFVRILGTSAKMPWSNVCFSQAIGQMSLALPGLYVFGQKLTFDMSYYVVGLLLLGGIIGAWSQILMTIGMQREKSAAATAMRMSDVACGFLWQVLFTADALSLLSLGGAVLITTSILIVVIFKQTTSPAAQASSKETTPTAEKSVELAQIRATMSHIADRLNDQTFDLEDGFEDSSIDEDDPDGEALADWGGPTAGKFNYAALKARMLDDESAHGWENGNHNNNNNSKQGSVRSAGESRGGQQDTEQEAAATTSPLFTTASAAYSTLPQSV